MSTLSILAAVIALTQQPLSSTAQAEPAAAPSSPAACEAAVAEIVTGEARMQTLQAQLRGSVSGVGENARNTQAVAEAGKALGWATAVASFVPGVGFAASAAGAAVTQQAIEGQQRAIAATNQTLQQVVSELAPLGQRLHQLRTGAAAQGCELPPAPPEG